MSDAEFVRVIDTAIKEYRGNVEILESAIGVLAIGRHVGWKPMYLVHHRSTMARYQTVLGNIKFQKVLPAEGALANKSVAWRIARNLSNFWKAVKGERGNARTPEFLR